MNSSQSADGSERGHLRLASPDDDCAPELDLGVGDVVVYASHGIGCVEARRAGTGRVSDVVVVLFESGLRITLPVARARSALRALSGEVELEDVRRTLRADPPPSIEPWSRRLRWMRERVTAGDVTGLAEVVRDGLRRERELGGANGRAAVATSDRGLYLQARKLLAAEVAFARGIDPVDADVWLVDQTDECKP